MASIWKLGPSVFALMALGGCAGMSEGPIPVSQGIAPDGAEPDLSRIRRAMQIDCFNLGQTLDADDEAGDGERVAADDDDEAKQQRRNNLVTAYMAAVDIRYNAYERNLLAFSRQNDLGAALATQLVSAIGAASGSQAISEATNITSGAIGATQSAFSKSLLNQTVSVLQTHMRAQRLQRLATNTEHLALTYAQWNSCQALQDALAYEQAGTLNAALAAMAASATDQERNGRAQAESAIPTVRVASGTLVTALDGFMFPQDNSRWAERVAVARRIVVARNLYPDPDLSVEDRLNLILDADDPAREADRRSLIQAIVEDTSVAESLKASLRAALAGQGE
jgi:hypothetical protein